MRKFLISLLVVVGTVLPAHAQEFTLSQAVDRALKANPSLEAKVYALEQAKMRVGVAQSYFWPRVSLVASSTQLRNTGEVATLDDLSSNTDSYGVRLTMSLFAGFSHLNSMQRSIIEVDIAEAQCCQAELELCTNVQLQFLQLLKARRDMVNVEASITRLETQLKSAQAFVKVGMAPYLNVLQNEVELSQAQQQKLRVSSDIRTFEIQLNQFLGFDPNEPVAYVGRLEDFPRNMEFAEAEAIRRAMEKRPDLLIARKSVEATRSQSLATAGRFLPQVDATFDSMRSKRDYQEPKYKDYTKSYTSMGINMTWNIFEGGQTSFGYAADRKQLRSLEKEYDNARSSAKTDVIKAIIAIRTAEDVLATGRKGVEAAKESYAMAEKRYSTDVGTITELLDAQNRLTQAEATVNQALAEYQCARVRYHYDTGSINADLH